MNRPLLTFEDKIAEAGFSVDFFWESVDLIIGEKIYTESEDPVDVARWFFFSQILFLVTAKHPVFQNNLLTIEKGGLSKGVTALSYFFILFAQDSVAVSPVALFLTGKTGDASVVEAYLKSCYGDEGYSRSLSASQGFLAELIEKEKKEKLGDMLYIKAPVLLSFLKRLKISPADYLAACRMNAEVFKTVPVSHRGQKMFFYWKVLFYAMAFPEKADMGDSPLISPFITQGNLNSLEFAILHYMLLWKNLSAKEVGKAHAFFSLEAQSLALMLKEELSSEQMVPGEELQVLLSLVRIKVGDFKYVAALRTVTEAMNYISGTEKA